MGDAQRTSSELIPGTLDMLILKTVSRSDAMHGYDAADSELLQVADGNARGASSWNQS